MAFKCRVLLAEDSPVNQEVGRAMLEAVGCRVEVAGNGLEALHLAKSNKYDLILMDCQMPEMDGWEAARKIREAEREGSSRIPIVAMTAYVMDEELQKCRASGMDDHLGKPFSLRDLSEMVKRWTASRAGEDGDGTGEAGPAATESGVEAAEKSSPCLDPQALKDLKTAFGQSAVEMVSAVIKIYLLDSPPLVMGLGEALESEDFEAVRRAAHTLKSSSANLGANGLAELCKKIEDLAGSRSIEGVEDLVKRIENEYRRVEDALRAELHKGD